MRELDLSDLHAILTGQELDLEQLEKIYGPVKERVRGRRPATPHEIEVVLNGKKRPFIRNRKTGNCRGKNTL